MLEPTAVAAVSRGELERRWKIVRDELKARDIDALIVSGFGPDHSGQQRWLTDTAYVVGRRTVVFHRDDRMTVITAGAVGDVRKIGNDDSAAPGVGEIHFVGEFAAVNYTQRYHADALDVALGPRGYKRIAVASADTMPKALIGRLEASLQGKTEIVDLTDFLDRAMAIKSPEEIKILHETARMQDRVFEAVLGFIKPGQRCIEVTAFARRLVQSEGSHGGIFLCNTAPAGIAAPYASLQHQGRTIRPGDTVTLLIENSGPYGYFCELGRTIVMGKAQSELLETAEKAKAAQVHTMALYKPGASCTDIWNDYNAYARSVGINEEHRLYSHSQGYNIVERPMIRDDETLKVEADMCFAIHPTLESKSVFFTYCDNYMIGPDGVGPCMHKTEQKVFEV